MDFKEKMLLLLKLLRDRVKVEAVVGNDQHARNLRILAYSIKAANDEQRQQLIQEELGGSMDVRLCASLDLASASTYLTFHGTGVGHIFGPRDCNY